MKHSPLSTTLPDLLGEIILEQEGNKIYQCVETLRKSFIKQRKNAYSQPNTKAIDIIESLDPNEIDKVIHAFTTFFHLINIDEELKKEIARSNRDNWKNSFKETLTQFKTAQIKPEKIQELITSLCYYPTFTAHPTEAKRPIILASLQNIYSEYKSLLSHKEDTLEYNFHKQRLKALIQISWKTETVRQNKPTVYDEIENALYYFRETLFPSIPKVQRDLKRALKANYPEVNLENLSVHCPMQFGSWIGGDRDGNPYVTANITKDALSIYKIEILNEYQRRVNKLKQYLTHSANQFITPSALLDCLHAEKQRFPNLFQSNRSNEPYYKKLEIIELRLQATIIEQQKNLSTTLSHQASRPMHGHPHLAEYQSDLLYKNHIEFIDDLNLIKDTLIQNNEKNLTEGELEDLFVLVNCCQFHLSKLDIRQESSLHTQAIHEIAANLADEPFDYRALNEQKRIDWLTKTLLDAKAVDFDYFNLTLQSDEIITVFKVMQSMHQSMSQNCFGTYIISMTHQASHLLEVALLAKIAGLITYTEQGEMAVNIKIAPLSETIEDLHRVENVLSTLFNNSAYTAIVKSNDNMQEVMLGYSDSCKDGGIIASSWNLYKSQKRIVDICQKHRIQSLIFHGRGGTIGRGGGPTHDSILSQPAGTVNGKIKFTEQGEVLSFKYNFADTARYELTVGITGLMKASLLTQDKENHTENSQIMEMLSKKGEAHFRALTDNNADTMNYFYQTTPSQEIGLLNIGSRPSHRKKADQSKSSIRAIGWVFGWSQSRQNIPGWYGLGTALQHAIDNGQLEQLQKMNQQWRYFRNFLSNTQMVILKTDQQIAEYYSKLCQDSEIADKIFQQVSQEYELAKQCIQKITNSQEMMSDFPDIGQAIKWRNAYLDPLNHIQVTLLKRLQHAPDRLQSKWLDPALHSINGIATGLRNTG